MQKFNYHTHTSRCGHAQKTLKDEDLNIQSWILWVTSSFSYTLYAILVSKDGMLIFETCLELFFCLLILILAIIYRNKK